MRLLKGDCMMHRRLNDLRIRARNYPDQAIRANGFRVQHLPGKQDLSMAKGGAYSDDLFVVYWKLPFSQSARRDDIGFRVKKKKAI